MEAWAPDRIVLLPLYPQFSTTTIASSLKDWRARRGKGGHDRAPFPHLLLSRRARLYRRPGGADARNHGKDARPDISYRLLLSAHGLPERVVASGDPYRWQVEQTAAALVERLGITDWTVCYQSRVGPLKWIEPATDAEIRRAGADGKGVIIVPIAFVSEHSETLVELDMDYAKLARERGRARLSACADGGRA